MASHEGTSSGSPSSQAVQDILTSSDALSVTPATSLEVASSSSKRSLSDRTPDGGAARELRTRRSQIGSYKESVLSGTAKRVSSVRNGNRTISGETLVDDGPTNQLLQNSIDALDLEWSAQQSPLKGANTEGTSAGEGKLKRRRSTRLEGLAKATTKMVERMTVLGKRGRNAVDAGKIATLNVAKSLQRKASLRTKAIEPKPSGDEEPPMKKNRLSKAEPGTKDKVPPAASAPVAARKRVKIWLDRGLYVGQERTFNPRLTESRNRLKAASAMKTDGERLRTFLPLPMFAGERLLEIGRDFKLPFDVFSPLPPGQPKPEEWKKKSKSES